MKIPPSNPSIRQGRFQWMDDSAKNKYISVIKKRIADGYYFSEKVITQVVDEIAPVVNDTVEQDGLP
jgi:hypothetical protein